MRKLLWMLIVLSFVLHIASLGPQAPEAEAGSAFEFYTITQDSTVVTEPFGGISMVPLNGPVGIKVYGPRQAAGRDSVVVGPPHDFGLNLYEARQRARRFRVSPSGGATALVIVW